MCLGGRLIGRCCRIPIGGHQAPIKREPPKPVPLTGVEVSAKIVDFVAEVTLHQRYENVEDVPIEATYVFPLPEGASVSSFYAIVNGEKIAGKIKEKEQAKDTYDDAIASGHSAYLLEKSEKKNMFKASIGNLPPKEQVVIAVVYVTELSFVEDKKLEFVIPTDKAAYPDGVVVPRFFQPTKQIQIDKAVVPAYGLKLNVSLEMTSKIKTVSSPSHPIEFESGDTPTSASVKLANEDVGVPLLKDFALRISLANPDSPVFRVQDGVGMLALYPSLIEDDEDPITEMIFLVDRSGSMSGAKIQRVKDTLHIFLRSLPLGTLFNIVGFGSNYVSLFPKSKEYDDSTLAEATKHVNDLKANLGGTSLLPPMKHIFAQPIRQGIPRQVFVLTDGEVDNTDECIRFVRDNATTTRVFAFGIHGASPKLVNGLAKAGEGKAEIISGNENIEGKVMIQLKRALQPALTDLKIDWGTLAAEQTPFQLPPLFGGSRLIAYGYLSPDAKPGTIVFTANSVKGPYRFEHPVTEEDLKPVSGINFIPKLAARSMIRDLEEKRSSYHKKPSFSEADNKKKIIELSLKSGMLSKYTAFIAVNENSKATEAAMESRDVNKLSKPGSASWGSSLHGKVLKPSMRRASFSDSASSGSESDEDEAPVPSRKIFLSSSISASSGPKEISYEYEDPVRKSLTSSLSSSVSNRSRGAAPAVNTTGASKGSMLKSKKMKESKDKSVNSSAPARPAARLAAVPMLQKSSSASAAPPAPAASSAAPRSSSVRSFAFKAEESVQAPSTAQSGLKDIVLQQKAAGNFSEDALKLGGGSLDKLRAAAPDQIKAIAAALLDQILITLFICGILRTKFKAESDQWSLVEKKALTWVKKEAKKVDASLADFDWNSLATKLVA